MHRCQSMSLPKCTHACTLVLELNFAENFTMYHAMDDPTYSSLFSQPNWRVQWCLCFSSCIMYQKYVISATPKGGQFMQKGLCLSPSDMLTRLCKSKRTTEIIHGTTHIEVLTKLSLRTVLKNHFSTYICTCACRLMKIR